MNDSNKEDSHLEEVDIDDVKLGMYIEDVIEGDDRLVVSENRKIRSTDQIEDLKGKGVKKVRINLQKGEDLGRVAKVSGDHHQFEAPKREVEYFKELDKAVEVHKDGLERTTEVLKAIREGKPFSIATIKTAAEDIVQSIMRNPDALLSLSQLKDYDNYTFMHSVNVAILIVSAAYQLDYPGDRLVEIGTGGLLHDIGKMRVPEKILNKPGKLTDSEFAVIKRHPELGMESILDQRGVSDIAKKVVLQHHERYNGRGYPFGIKGERIHEVGLISAVADVYDALTSDRIYKAAWTPQKALATIFQQRDRDYCSRIVDLFTKMMGVYPVGSFVKLVSGEMGVVIRIEQGSLLAPDLLVLFDKYGKRLKTPFKVELSKKQVDKDGAQYKIEMSLNPRAFNVNVSDFIVKTSGLLYNKV